MLTLEERLQRDICVGYQVPPARDGLELALSQVPATSQAHSAGAAANLNFVPMAQTKTHVALSPIMY